MSDLAYLLTEATHHHRPEIDSYLVASISHHIVAACSCPSPSLHYSPSDDSLNTKVLTLADCGYCGGKVVVRL